MSWLPSFLRPKDPKELVQKWRKDIRKEKNEINRNIRTLHMEQKKVERSIKEAARRNDLVSAKTLAKELVRSRKAVTRLLENRATLDALDMQIADSLRNYRLSKTIKASGEMMKTMNKLVKLPQLQNTVKEMSREMEYAGFVSECMNDAIDAAVDREDYDELADEAVDQVLLEICGDTLSEAATVPLAKVKTLERKEKDMEADDDELMRQIIAGEI